MAFPSMIFGLLLLSLVGGGFSEDEASPRGCGSFLKRPFTALCDLDAVWGVAAEAAAGGAALASLVMVLVLLCRLRRIAEPEKRSGVAPLLLLLAAIVGLCALSFAYLIELDERLCIIRRSLWGALFAMCFACLVTQGVRLRRLVRGARSPGGCALAGLAVGLATVQGIIAAEWILLTVVRQGQQACQYQPLDFALACTYVLVLLVASLVAAACGLCGEQSQWKCNAAWLLATCIASVLLWAAWLIFYLYGNVALGLSSTWDDPAQAVVLVAQAWLLLLLHAVPEAHACLRPAPQPSGPDYFDTSQAPPRLREASFDEDIPLSHRQFGENQGFSFEDSNTARSGSQRNGNTGTRPSAPFRSNVYQPTEMTMILNGGAVSTAPPSAAHTHTHTR
uniref:G protein-coupled receptor, class C, group 5, member Ba n=1 Tax=Paramormyrops kingsleyae TaxID=1676925 RepID=A0A3B3RT38_9TELE